MFRQASKINVFLGALKMFLIRLSLNDYIIFDVRFFLFCFFVRWVVRSGAETRSSTKRRVEKTFIDEVSRIVNLHKFALLL